MKNIIQALTVTSFAVILISCGSNSSDKETTATTDTVVTSPIDTVTATADTVAAIAVTVPAKTKKNFEEKYPQATKVKWESNKAATKGVEWDLNDGSGDDEGGGHNAWFNWQGSDHKAYYDDKGDWVGTVDILVDPSSLPAAVTNSLNKEFSGYLVTGIKRKNDNNRNAFQVTLEKDGAKVKALVDENGTILKKK